MIKRQYFISGKKPRDDGNGSYSFAHFKYVTVSWFPDSLAAFKGGLEAIEETLNNRPGGAIEVVCFTRC